MQMYVVLIIAVVIVAVLILMNQKNNYQPVSIEVKTNRPYTDAVLRAASRLDSEDQSQEIQRAFNTLQHAVNPSELGDPIIYPPSVGPVASPTVNQGILVYDSRHPGPQVGVKMGVPVPQGTMASYSIDRNRNLISSREPAFRTAFPGSPLSAPPPIVDPRLTSYATMQRPLPSDDFFRPYGPNTPPQFPSFVGSVSSFAPVPEVITPWEKAGILISDSSNPPALLNLFRRPIAPLQDLWEYNVQDADGFVIRLNQTKFIENGDVISNIPGKPGLWKANLPTDNKYVWV